MKPKIIVSVLDSLSAPKDAALAKALSLARWYESDVHALYVGPSKRVGDSGDDEVREELARRITRLAEGAGTAGVDIIAAVLSGNPVRAIAEYTDRVSADLVVVGKKAQRASGYWSAGSFATAVGKAVNSPTIAISSREPAPAYSGSPFRNIVVGVDFSEASFRALSEALVLVQESGGHLWLLHVVEGFPYQTVYSGARAFRLMDDFDAHVKRINRRLRALIPPDALNWAQIDVATVSGLAHEAIAAAAAERRADLVVLGLPRRTRLEEFVAGSTVHRVLRRATSPVLLVPGPAAPALARAAAKDEDDVQFATAASAFGLRAAIEADRAREGGPSWR